MDREDTIYFTYKHAHTRILLSYKKEWNFAIFNNMDRTGEYYT